MHTFSVRMGNQVEELCIGASGWEEMKREREGGEG